MRKIADIARRFRKGPAVYVRHCHRKGAPDVSKISVPIEEDVLWRRVAADFDQSLKQVTRWIASQCLQRAAPKFGEDRAWPFGA
ncbi:MAG: hypothetical protein AAFN51_00115 [Pseudomonadota bacterium]